MQFTSNDHTVVHFKQGELRKHKSSRRNVYPICDSGSSDEHLCGYLPGGWEWYKKKGIKLAALQFTESMRTRLVQAQHLKYLLDYNVKNKMTQCEFDRNSSANYILKGKAHFHFPPTRNFSYLSNFQRFLVFLIYYPLQINLRML